MRELDLTHSCSCTVCSRCCVCLQHEQAGWHVRRPTIIVAHSCAAAASSPARMRRCCSTATSRSLLPFAPSRRFAPSIHIVHAFFSLLPPPRHLSASLELALNCKLDCWPAAWIWRGQRSLAVAAAAFAAVHGTGLGLDPRPSNEPTPIRLCRLCSQSS